MKDCPGAVDPDGGRGWGKEGVRYFRALLAPENDGAPLPAPACRAAPGVVVKRPLHAAALVSEPGPTHVLKGKSVRYDVYMH